MNARTAIDEIYARAKGEAENVASEKGYSEPTRKLIEESRRHEYLIDYATQLETALRAVLLFHSASPWDDDKRAVWRSLTGTDEATTKTLCDAIRKVLNR